VCAIAVIALGAPSLDRRRRNFAPSALRLRIRLQAARRKAVARFTTRRVPRLSTVIEVKQVDTHTFFQFAVNIGQRLPSNLIRHVVKGNKASLAERRTAKSTGLGGHRSAMSENPVCVAPTGDVCGEGAVWHAAHKAVYWTDINRFLVHRFTPADQCVRTWFFDEPVTALTLTDRDEVLTVVLGSRLILWEPAANMRHDHAFHLEGWPKIRLNDARSDPRGSLWAGSMRNNVNSDGSAGAAGGRDGVLFRLDPDAKVTQWQRDIGISNTLAWSPDQRRFYFGDTLANTVWVYDYDLATGTIGNQRPFLEGFARGLPDGSTVDSEGYLWNCRFFGGCIVRVAPDGQIDRVVEMPVKNITTCTFGGPDRKTLYVTTASIQAPPSDRLAGSLYAIDTEVAGQPENRFCLFGRAG
jgi:sugar lactone lactonase YvrE